MAIYAYDIDGTIDENPAGFGSQMVAQKQAGHRVVILTGCSAPKPTPQDLQDKAEYLQSLGVGDAYDQLVVFGDPPHKAKAKWCKHNMGSDDVLYENSVKNAQLAAKYVTVCLVWNSKVD